MRRDANGRFFFLLVRGRCDRANFWYRAQVPVHWCKQHGMKRARWTWKTRERVCMHPQSCIGRKGRKRREREKRCKRWEENEMTFPEKEPREHCHVEQGWTVGSAWQRNYENRTALTNTKWRCKYILSWHLTFVTRCSCQPRSIKLANTESWTPQVPTRSLAFFD